MFAHAHSLASDRSSFLHVVRPIGGMALSKLIQSRSSSIHQFVPAWRDRPNKPVSVCLRACVRAGVGVGVGVCMCV